jgi:hypothetical protein
MAWLYLVIRLIIVIHKIITQYIGNKIDQNIFCAHDEVKMSKECFFYHINNYYSKRRVYTIVVHYCIFAKALRYKMIIKVTLTFFSHLLPQFKALRIISHTLKWEKKYSSLSCDDLYARMKYLYTLRHENVNGSKINIAYEYLLRMCRWLFDFLKEFVHSTKSQRQNSLIYSLSDKKLD